MSAPFRAGHLPVSDQLSRGHPTEVPVLRILGSCCLSAIGIRLLGHPAPAGELHLPHGRPTGVVAGPQRGCRVAHAQAATGQGAPLTPGTVVRSRPATILRPAPAALPRPVPTAPLEHPIGGGHLHEASSGVHSRSPITPGWLAASPGPGSLTAPRRSSPRLRPSDGTRAASALTPGFAPRSHPRRTPRRRQAIAHWPGYYTLDIDISRTSNGASHLSSCTLTSHIVFGGLLRTGIGELTAPIHLFPIRPEWGFGSCFGSHDAAAAPKTQTPAAEAGVCAGQ
jgi:hypothetical protein